MLTATEPADRSVIEAPPPELVLRFNEPVKPVALRLLDSAGKSLTTGRPVSVDSTVRVALPAGLAKGDYVVSWRVTSADAHPVAGAFLFAVGRAPDSWRSEQPGPSFHAFWSTGIVVNRALHLAALMLAVGGAVYPLLTLCGWRHARPALSRTIGCAAAVAGLTALCSIGLQGAAIADVPPADIFGTVPWQIGAGTTRGLSSVVATAGMIAILIALAAGGSVRRVVGTGGALAGAGSTVLSGHAAGLHPVWLFSPVLLLHVAIAAFWIGSLIPLRHALRERGAGAWPEVGAFSRIAVVGIPMLIAAGLVFGLSQLHQPSDITGTSYGRLLTVKLILTAALIGLGGINRLLLLPRLRSGRTAAGRAMRRVLGLEVACALALLIAAALLSQTAPPAAPNSASGGDSLRHRHAPGLSPFSTHVRSGERAAAIGIAPAVAGRNTITVGIFDREGRRIAPAALRIELSNPSAGVEPIVREMTRTPDGTFRHTGPEFLLPGTWTLRVEALIDDFEKAIFETKPVIAGDVPPRQSQRGAPERNQSPNSRPMAR